LLLLPRTSLFKARLLSKEHEHEKQQQQQQQQQQGQRLGLPAAKAHVSSFFVSVFFSEGARERESARGEREKESRRRGRRGGFFLLAQPLAF
jgi:hypothetical protein